MVNSKIERFDDKNCRRRFALVDKRDRRKKSYRVFRFGGTRWCSDRDFAIMSIATTFLTLIRRIVIPALAFIVISIGSVVPGHAETITVQGNSRIDATTIQSYVTGQTPEMAKKDLLATGLFASVDVVKKGDSIVVTVKENNIINRVAFEGNKRLKSEVFDGELQLKSRGAFTQAALDADIVHIKEIYQRVGRSNVDVKSRIVQLENGKIDVVFTVDEGKKTGVKSIEFAGNAAFSSGRLRDEMQTTESNWLSWIKTTDVYDADRIAADTELVRRFYLKHGYADMRVADTKVDYDADAAGYRVLITVEEGKQYKVGSIDIESKIAEITPDMLRSRLKLAPGDIYNADMVEKTIFGITTEVSSRGYAFSQVRPKGDRDQANGIVKLSFVVDEGPRVYIERINIRGNTRTRDMVIRREFDIGEGDAYNKVLIDRTERRLNNLGFFKSVRISNEPGSTPDRVIVNVEVEDKSTGQFSIGGGYSTSEGLIAQVGVSESNFLGRGQYASIKGSTGQYTKGVEFNFTEPYFMDRHLAAGIDLYSKRSDNSRFAYYSNTKTGATVRLGAPLTEEFTVTGRYSLYNNNLTVTDTTNASVAIQSAEGNNITSAVGYTLSYNTIDNNQNPRNGILNDLKQDVAGFGGNSRYIKTSNEIKIYRELSDNFVGLLHGQAGYIYSDNLRIIDGFFMGPELVRGFSLSGIGARDSTTSVSRNALGGTTYVGASSELQFPIFGLAREVGIKGAVFADAGTLFGYSGSTNNVSVVGDDRSIRSSIGAGVLWSSPVGPIRLDFAFPVTKNDYDQTQVFRFSAGSVF
jgi:outer membrane protein insertion porin family